MSLTLEAPYELQETDEDVQDWDVSTFWHYVTFFMHTMILFSNAYACAFYVYLTSVPDLIPFSSLLAKSALWSVGSVLGILFTVLQRVAQRHWHSVFANVRHHVNIQLILITHLLTFFYFAQSASTNSIHAFGDNGWPLALCLVLHVALTCCYAFSCVDIYAVYNKQKSQYFNKYTVAIVAMSLLGIVLGVLILWLEHANQIQVSYSPFSSIVIAVIQIFLVYTCVLMTKCF